MTTHAGDVEGGCRGLLVGLALAAALGASGCCGCGSECGSPDGGSDGGTCTPVATDALPPDPALLAPPVDPTVATDFAGSIAFLYTAMPPVQEGVAPGAVDGTIVGVLRGRVLRADGAPLGGVVVDILNHPEWGRTRSRADGHYDLAVNAAGDLVVRFGDGCTTGAQRRVTPVVHAFIGVPDVVLLTRDAKATRVTNSGSFQAARGSVSKDNDGTRQPTLLFPPGTQAGMMMGDGSMQPLDTWTVRATEFTVGAAGPTSMPGTLPPSSAYTYALELSADEAVAGGATGVELNQEVPMYLENFLHMPVGASVPVGFYDAQAGYWAADSSGLVVKVLSISGGKADLDVDGSGAAASDDTLAAMGVSDGERQQLAGLYQPGASLWRVPLHHFSMLDLNWCSTGGSSPGDPEGGEPPNPDPCTEEGASTIECENQLLRESLPIPGTDYNLVYSSDRVPGQKARYSLDIPLTGASLAPLLQRVDLQVEVGGQLILQSFGPTPNLRTNFLWDGKDAYGRPLQGQQPVTVRVLWQLGGSYLDTPVFGGYGDGDTMGPATRQPVVGEQDWQGLLGTWNVANDGLGGWNLDAHHLFEPESGTLWLGNGDHRTATAVLRTIVTVAGGAFGSYSPAEEGGPATAAHFCGKSISAAPDGSLLIGDICNSRVRRIARDGTIRTLAGNGMMGSTGDGGLAALAALDAGGFGNFPIAQGPDGSVVIGENQTWRVRRVRPSGTIETLIHGCGEDACGTGQDSGDGGLATSAALGEQPIALGYGPDGALYVATWNDSVRKVDPSGIITTVAGGGMLTGDNLPARQADLSSVGMGLEAMAVGNDGSLYIGGNFVVWKLGHDGFLRRIAGTGTSGGSGDGGPALLASLDDVTALAAGPDGSVYVNTGTRIRRVTPDGNINAFAGGGMGGDNVPANQAAMLPSGMTATAEASLYVMDDLPTVGRVRRVSSPSFLRGGGFFVPSEDGRELFVFDAHGRHFKTVSSLTGAAHQTLAYNGAGHLVTISDAAGNVTTIERDGSGRPTAIVGPWGHRTTLTLDGNGYLATVTDPAGATVQLTHSADGLLQKEVDAKGQVKTFTYDQAGRLLHDSGDGVSLSLSRTGFPGGYEVTMKTALGRAQTWELASYGDGSWRRIQTDPAGHQSTLNVGPTSVDLSNPDGSGSFMLFGPDPRFGMLAPIPNQMGVKDGPLDVSGGMRRDVTMSDPTDPLTLRTLVDTFVFNGNTSTRAFDVASRTLTVTTPAGRVRKYVLDNFDHLTSFQTAGLTPMTIVSDGLGRPNTLTRGASHWTFAWDTQGALTGITDPLMQSLAIGHDAANRPTSLTLADTRELLYARDGNGLVSALTQPGGGETDFGYDAADALVSVSPPPVSGARPVTRFVFDADHDLSAIMRADGTSIAIDRDDAGRVATVKLGGGSLQYLYDDLLWGQLAEIKAADGTQLDFIYDGSYPTVMAWSGEVTGEVDLAWDKLGNPAGDSINGEDSVTLVRDADGLITAAGDLTVARDAATGLVTSLSLGNLTETWSQDANGAPSARTLSFSGSPILADTWTRDALGRVATRDETLSGVSHHFVYHYDAAGRLSGVDEDGAPVEQYGYDGHDNRTSANAVTAAYDARDRLLTSGATTCQFSDAGDLTSCSDGSSYRYDELGALLGVTLPARRIDYLVDGFGRRVGKKVGGTLTQQFLYRNQLDVVAELDGAGTLVSHFVHGPFDGPPAYIIKGGAKYFVASDLNGSVRLVVDSATGAIAQRIDYDGFGKVTADSAPGFQPFGFAAGLYDPDTRLVRFGARDYDAATGRWLSTDPLLYTGREINLYEYADGDPVNGTDPTGLQKGAFWIGDGAGFGVEFGAGKSHVCISTGLSTPMAQVEFSLTEKLPPPGPFVKGEVSVGPLTGELSVDPCSNFKGKVTVAAPLEIPGGKLGPSISQEWNFSHPGETERNTGLGAERELGHEEGGIGFGAKFSAGVCF